MIPDVVSLGGGAIGAIIGARWLMRVAALASILKVVAGVIIALAALSIVGVLDVSINGEIIAEGARFTWRHVRGLVPLVGGGLA